VRVDCGCGCGVSSGVAHASSSVIDPQCSSPGMTTSACSGADMSGCGRGCAQCGCGCVSVCSQWSAVRMVADRMNVTCCCSSLTRIPLRACAVGCRAGAAGGCGARLHETRWRRRGPVLRLLTFFVSLSERPVRIGQPDSAVEQRASTEHEFAVSEV
jgi:hypothetical protein